MDMANLSRIGKPPILNGKSLAYRRMTARQRAELVLAVVDGERELAGLSTAQLCGLLRVSTSSVTLARKRRRQYTNGHLIPLLDLGTMPELERVPA